MNYDYVKCELNKYVDQLSAPAHLAGWVRGAGGRVTILFALVTDHRMTDGRDKVV